MTLAALIVLAFLVGSIPFGVLVGRIFFNTDIRTSGSGNIGAANALRTYGKRAGVAVLVLDALKGFVPVWTATALFGDSHWPAVGAAIAALVGHCYSPWLGGRGGKGVATHLGALLALSPLAGLAFAATWLAAALPTGYSSVGSLVGTLVSVVALTWLLGPAGLAYGAFAATVIGWRHRANLQRLRAGTENAMSLFDRWTI